MSNIDKHVVQSVADLKAGYILGHADVATSSSVFAAGHEYVANPHKGAQS